MVHCCRIQPECAALVVSNCSHGSGPISNHSPVATRRESSRPTIYNVPLSITPLPVGATLS